LSSQLSQSGNPVVTRLKDPDHKAVVVSELKMLRTQEVVLAINDYLGSEVN
jgi:hypothetical protein